MKIYIAHPHDDHDGFGLRFRIFKGKGHRYALLSGYNHETATKINDWLFENACDVVANGPVEHNGVEMVPPTTTYELTEKQYATFQLMFMEEDKAVGTRH